MAHFFARIRGNRGDATRLGSQHSGMTADVNGWNNGVTVKARFDPNLGDVFTLYATGGSNGRTKRVKLGDVIAGDFHPHYDQD